MAYTVVSTHESTHNVDSNRGIRHVDRELAYVDAEQSPLLTVTMSMKGGTGTASRTDRPKHEWMEKESKPPSFSQVNGAHTAGDVTIAVDDGEFFRAGDVAVIPRTGEAVRVTSVSGDDLTVVRSIGDASGTAAAAINDNDDIYILSNAAAQGDDVRTPRSWNEEWKYNNTQIIRTEFGATRTEQGAANYTGDTLARLQKENLFRHKLELEQQAIFGERSDNLGTSNAPAFTMGGVLYYATSNNKTSVGTLTEPEVEDWAQDLFQSTGGGTSRLWLASPLTVSAVDMIAGGRLQVVPKEDTFGVAIKTWVTAHGTFNITKHPLFIDGPGATGYSGLSIALAPKKLKFCFFANGKTALKTNRQSPGADKRTDEYLTEGTIEFKNPVFHGTLEGLTG